MYHRRRRGEPFKNPESKNYIKWSVKLQNALIKADSVPEFKWSNLAFNAEKETLAKYKINVDDQLDELPECVLGVAEEKSEEDEWTVVSNEPSIETKKYVYILQEMFLLPVPESV
jgi:hypothetical protein